MRLVHSTTTVGLLLIAASLLLACDREQAPQPRPAKATPDAASTVDAVTPVSSDPQLVAPAPQAASEDAPGDTAPADRFVGDLAQLKRRGRLRILIPANIGGAFYLPRAGWPVEAQHEAAESFAHSQGLEPVLVPVERFADMIPALLEGRGDVIAANLGVTEGRRRKIAFSVPLTTVRQQVVVARARKDLQGTADLSGQRVMVDRSSSFWEHLGSLRKQFPGITLVERPDGMSDEAELDAVASGEVDATVRDSNVASMYLSYRDDIQVAFDLPGTHDIAWGIRPDAHKLRAALNKFLHLEFLAENEHARYKDGWEGIKKRKVLRVLLRNNAASYFLYKGELHGFEYELAKAFADANKLRLEVIVPDTHEQLLDWLVEGRADVAAGFLEPTDEAAERGLAFSQSYHHAPRHLVVHEGDDSVSCARDLEGRTVSVRRSSPYWKDLLELQGRGIRFTLQAAPEVMETEELIAQVASGELDATVADGHLLDIELARGLPVRSGLQLSDDRSHAVAVRKQNGKLLAELNRFIKKEYKGLVYNILYKKYFGNPRNVRDLADGRPGGATSNGLSPFDDITRKYAEQYGFDWRLITAQMYQESRFDPQARSFAGASGLLQVMPRTAKFMGFAKVQEPEVGIHAGIKYLDWVRNRFDPELPFNERMWFTLAAYNAGHGHVEDARRLARQQGMDGDRWFDNSEKAMLLLSKKQYAGKARHGYVRGTEPVAYVRDIRERYRAYVEISSKRLPEIGAAADPVAPSTIAPEGIRAAAR